MPKKLARKPSKRTAVARAVPSPDTQTCPDPRPWRPSVFVVMGHRGGSHGVIGLYATREAAAREMFELIAKGNKHSREYTFTIDERHIQH